MHLIYSGNTAVKTLTMHCWEGWRKDLHPSRLELMRRHAEGGITSAVCMNTRNEPVKDSLDCKVMGGPNLEVFKFGLYLFVPVVALLHFGDPHWYHEHVLPVSNFRRWRWVIPIYSWHNSIKSSCSLVATKHTWYLIQSGVLLYLTPL